MGQTQIQPKTDPLRAFAAGAFTKDHQRPIPLISTEFDVEITGRLVIVATRRVFRNAEEDSIEATITFPVPVHAVLFELEAKIGERIVNAKTQRKREARASYEDAITRGKTSVLHEEVLRGVHMLSVANIAPGMEISVSSTWVSALNYVGNRGQVRIPLSVGDIYGRAPLADTDDFLTGGPPAQADIIVRCTNGHAHIASAQLIDGRARVPMNRPIDLVIEEADQVELRGVAADGRDVCLHIMPEVNLTDGLNVAIIVDHSGSMETQCRGEPQTLSKHQAVVAGLTSLANELGDGDIADLWEFSGNFANIGSVGANPGEADNQSANRAQLLNLVKKLSAPTGGTEIGRALNGVLGASAAPDILLITDGNSHAIEIQQLSRLGRRITVVLIGEDSLEANVGALAAQTGGGIYVASDTDIALILSAALESLRIPFELPKQIENQPTEIDVLRGRTRIRASWGEAAPHAQQDRLARAVSVFAASLALPAMEEDEATLLAEQEGFVNHLTSLVLVDEVGGTVDGIPATRRIALTHMHDMSLSSPMDVIIPSADIDMPAFYRADVFCETSSEIDWMSVRSSEKRIRKPASLFERISSRASAARLSLIEIARMIEWGAAPTKLVNGNLSGLPIQVIDLIKITAAQHDVIVMASSLGIDSIILVIGAMARSQSSQDRSAERISRAIFANQSDPALVRLVAQLGLI